MGAHVTGAGACAQTPKGLEKGRSVCDTGVCVYV